MKFKELTSKFSKSARVFQKILQAKAEVKDGIEVENSTTIVIYTCRPGILIGKRGINIEELTKHLQMKIKVVEEEDHVLFYLNPQRELIEEDWEYIQNYPDEHYSEEEQKEIEDSSFDSSWYDDL